MKKLLLLLLLIQVGTRLWVNPNNIIAVRWSRSYGVCLVYLNTNNNKYLESDWSLEKVIKSISKYWEDK